MKRSAPEHPKTIKLAFRLKIERWGAVGILESIWHFAAKHSIRGDIGKWSDEDIAYGIGWLSDPTVLVESLVDCRWLDRNELHRLLVHDWQDHAEDSVKKTLANRGLTFAVFDTFPETSGNSPSFSDPVSQGLAKAKAKAKALARGRKSFVKPTVDEVVAYCTARGNGINAQEFIAHYETRGWLVGKNQTPMKSWKGAIATWEETRKKNLESSKPVSRILEPHEFDTWTPE